MPPIRQLPQTHALFSMLNRLESVLIVAMALLLPFDHWFFGHIINPAPTRVLGLALCGIWALQIASRQITFRLHLWHVLALLFVAVCFYSAIFSPVIPNPDIDNFRYKLIAVAKIAAALLFLVLACQALDTTKILLFLRTHLVVGTVICIVSLVLYALHMTRIHSHGFALWVEPDIYTFVRIQGVSYEPHRFGAYAMTLIPWLLLPKLRSLLGISLPIALAALAVTFISLALSYAVSTYIALPVMLLLLAVHTRENLPIMLRIGLLITIALGLAMQIPAVRHGTADIIDVKMRGDSLKVRIHQWQLAIVETAVFPRTGVGPESYSYFLGQIDPRLKNATPVTKPPQSMLLGIMANTGLPGVGSFLLFMLGFSIAYIRRYRMTRADKSLSYAAMAIAFSHFVYQQSIWLPWSLNLWLFMAMAWAALQQSKGPTTNV